MLKRYRARLSFALSLLLIVSFFVPGAMAGAAAAAETSATAPTYSLTLLDSKPDDGELQVVVKGHGMTDLYAYEVNVDFDVSRLKFQKAETAIVGFSIQPIVKENHIQFAHTKVGNKAGDQGDVTLCTLTFEEIGSGEAFIEIKGVKLVDSRLAAATQQGNTKIAAAVKAAPNSEIFKDIRGHWAKDKIVKAVDLGIVQGYEDQTFRPDMPVTRAEFVVMMMRVLKASPDSSGSNAAAFEDAASIPAWAKGYVSKAVSEGIVSGYEDRTFRPAMLITRAELAVMAGRALHLPIAAGEVLTFGDAADIPEWAAPYVAAEVKADIVHGRANNLFAPHEKTTRAEAVTLILAMLQTLQSKG